MRERAAESARQSAGLATMFSGATAAANADRQRTTTGRYEEQMAERRAELDRVNREGAAASREEAASYHSNFGVGAGVTAQTSQMLTHYGDTARHVADQVTGAFEDMTGAVSAHIEAVSKGRETLKDAALGVLSDFLFAMSKRATVSALEEIGRAHV